MSRKSAFVRSFYYYYFYYYYHYYYRIVIVVLCFSIPLVVVVVVRIVVWVKGLCLLKKNFSSTLFAVKWIIYTTSLVLVTRRLLVVVSVSVTVTLAAVSYSITTSNCNKTQSVTFVCLELWLEKCLFGAQVQKTQKNIERKERKKKMDNPTEN